MPLTTDFLDLRPLKRLLPRPRVIKSMIVAVADGNMTLSTRGENNKKEDITIAIKRKRCFFISYLHLIERKAYIR